MVIPFFALIAVIIGIVLFAVLAGRKKAEGDTLGDPGAQSTNQSFDHHTTG